MSGGGGGSTTSTNILYSPEEAARREKVMAAAEALFGASPTETPPYPGAQPVAKSPYTASAMNMATNIAGQQAGTIPLQTGALQYGLHDIIYGEDPTLQGAITAATRPIHEAFTGPTGYFAQNRDDMIGSGMLGSSRDALANAVIGSNYTRGLGDTSAKLAAASRADTLNTFGRTLAVAPGVTAGLTAPADTLASVGAQDEAYSQQAEDYIAAQKQWELNYPWMNLQNYANIVFGGQSPGTTSYTQTDANGNPIMGAVGGAAAGYAMGGMIGGAQMGATYGPYGAAIGALIGYMMSR